MSNAPLLLKRSGKCISRDLVLGEEHTGAVNLKILNENVIQIKNEYDVVGRVETKMHFSIFAKMRKWADFREISQNFFSRKYQKF
jgi:hypothetical protein